MYADLVLYSEPKRPQINPKFDLFAWLTAKNEPDLIFPAKVVSRIQIMLPDRARLDDLGDDLWKFLVWQVEEKGFTVVRSIDHNWWYWAMLADKYRLLNLCVLL